MATETEKTYQSAANANEAFPLAVSRYEEIVKRVRAVRNEGESKSVTEARKTAQEQEEGSAVEAFLNTLDEQLANVLSVPENSVSLFDALESRLAQVKSVRQYAEHLYRKESTDDTSEVSAEEIEEMRKIREEIIPAMVATLPLPYDGTLTMDAVQPFQKQEDGKPVFAKDGKTPLLAISNMPTTDKKAGRPAEVSLYLWSVEGAEETTSDVWYLVHRVINADSPGMVSVDDFLSRAKNEKAWGKEDVTFTINGVTVTGKREKK